LFRAVWFAASAALAFPVFVHGWISLASACFLVEFLSEARWRPLSAITHAAQVRPLTPPPDGPLMNADLYVAPSLLRPPGLVLVHGIAPKGKDDPRLQRAAALFARAGWAVAAPTIDGLTVLRLRPEDSVPVVASIRALARAGHAPVGVIGVSLGAGPALLAASAPESARNVSAVLALGGYASAVELLRYTLTGAYAFEQTRGARGVNEEAIALFARANAELVGADGRRLVENRDARSVDALVAALPEETRRLLDALSPERQIGGLRGPLFLIHGREDPAVPFTESLRLERVARAAGLPVSTVIVGAVDHVEPGARPAVADHGRRLWELARLWAALYAFRLSAGTSRWSTSGGPAP